MGFNDDKGKGAVGPQSYTAGFRWGDMPELAAHKDVNFIGMTPSATYDILAANLTADVVAKLASDYVGFTVSSVDARKVLTSLLERYGTDPHGVKAGMQAAGVFANGNISLKGLGVSGQTKQAQSNSKAPPYNPYANGGSPGGYSSYSDPTQMEMYSAYENMYGTLRDWGLEGIGEQLFNAVTQNHWINAKELLQWVRSTDAYKQQFPGLSEWNAKGQNKMTEQEYLTGRTAMMSMARQYGLPSSFFNNQEVGKLVAGGVSPAEFGDRLSKGWAVVSQGDPQIQRELHRLYGIGKHDLLAYYFDPQKARKDWQRSTIASQAAAYAKETGLQELTRQNAEQIARLVRTTGSSSVSSGGAINAGAPFDFTQVRNAFTSAARDLPLSRTGMGQQGTSGTKVSQDTLIGSQLAGYGDSTTQVQKQRAVQMAEQARMAPFEKGGGPAASDKGVFGAGHERM